MKKVGRFLLRLLIVLLLILIISLLVLDRFIQFRMDDGQYATYFYQKGLTPHISYYSSHNREIRYASIGKDTSATVFFIHGAPSSLSYYRDYMSDSTLLSRASMYAVDRPGYGYSGLGKPEPSIETQVQCIVPVLDSLNKVHHPLIIVGASYGSSIACRLVMDHPELADGLVIIAPPLAPGEEKVFWFSPLVESPVLNWIVPRMLQSANTEKLHHREELTKMLPLWKNIKIPVIYMQGADDGLVYTTNADFARKHFTNVPYLNIEMIKNRGHLLAFVEKDKIRNAIVQMIDLANKNIAGQLNMKGNASNLDNAATKSALSVTH
ncbi:alpha/beta hydrolase [Danxiaibacter flavus]|uniref:Alpha/beta hydrolase n=1 Tax=Danxiaibacter flavus TaxID=3049108 RepID=A0ABV3ZKC2_9BACT|nr:alpha/beta hydrolase [Chitinophagaceae bacterium DXS]